VASTRQRNTGLILAIAAWAFIFFITLYPIPDQAEVSGSTSIWCLVCGELGMVDVTLNIVLFVPLGLGLGLLGMTWSRGLLLVGVTTLTVEVLQLSVVAGRDASLSDLITNMLGGLLGLALALRWRQILFPSSRASALVAVTGAVAWLGLQGFTAFALQRVLPRSVYYGQWAPVLGQFEPFTGTVVSARLNEIPLPGTRLGNSDTVRKALLAPGSVLEVKATSGHPTHDVAPIFSIFDDRQREILLLGQDGLDLVFRVRTRTGPLGLRGPALQLSHALPPDTGVSIELRARYRPGHYQLDADVAGQRHTRDLALSASWGWTFLLPFDHAFGEEMPWLTMLWVGGLLLPIGYYFGRSDGMHSAGTWMLLIGLLPAGLILIPSLAGFSVLHPLEWAAGIAGGVGGFRLGLTSRLTPPGGEQLPGR
jgi:hypothetical protein